MNGQPTDVLVLFKSGPRQPVPVAPTEAFPQARRWGGRGSNPRPADYESAALTG